MAEDIKVNAARGSAQSVEESVGQSTDINNLKIKLIIFCTNSQAASSTATYLNRRGWEAAVTTNLKALFKLIGTIVPDFVMMSVNVNSSKMQELPRVITQTFNIPVIAFGENTDLKTLKLLSEARTKYNIQGLITGPGVHRKIKSVWQEIYDCRAEASKNGHVAKQVESLAPQPEVLIEKNDRAKGAGLFIIKSDKSESACAENTDKSEELLTGSESDENMTLEELIGLAKSKSQPTNNKQLETGSPTEIKTEIKTEINTESSDTAIEIKKAEDEAQRKIMRHLFEQCARAACEKVIEPVERLLLVDSCRAWPIKLSNKVGVLIFAHSGDERRQQEFIHNFFKQLNKEIRERAKQISYEDEVFVPLDAADIFAPIIGEVMTKKMESESSEVIIKFIEVPNLYTVENDESVVITKDKAKVHPADLTPNRTQGVNLYLHLPVNSKYFLYLKSNAVLSNKQQTKLVSTNTAVYVNNEDVKRYKEFVVRNKMAELFKNTSTNKKSAAS